MRRAPFTGSAHATITPGAAAAAWAEPVTASALSEIAEATANDAARDEETMLEAKSVPATSWSERSQGLTGLARSRRHSSAQEAVRRTEGIEDLRRHGAGLAGQHHAH